MCRKEMEPTTPLNDSDAVKTLNITQRQFTQTALTFFAIFSLVGQVGAAAARQGLLSGGAGADNQDRYSQTPGEDSEKSATAREYIAKFRDQMARSALDIESCRALVLEYDRIPDSVWQKLPQNSRLELGLELVALLDRASDFGVPRPSAVVSVKPPLGIDPGAPWAGGAGPESIRDPVKRQAYEEAIAANRQVAIRRAQQLEIQLMIDPSIAATLERLLKQPPANSNAEAASLVGRYVRDEKLRQRLISAITP
jgi:hypothetical protein